MAVCRRLLVMWPRSCATLTSSAAIEPSSRERMQRPGILEQMTRNLSGAPGPQSLLRGAEILSNDCCKRLGRSALRFDLVARRVFVSAHVDVDLRGKLPRIANRDRFDGAKKHAARPAGDCILENKRAGARRAHSNAEAGNQIISRDVIGLALRQCQIVDCRLCELNGSPHQSEAWKHPGHITPNGSQRVRLM
jgi:hypothetical protein